MKSPSNNKEGFSILEIPISLLIISTMFLIYGAVSNYLILNRNTRDQDLAHQIAASELEDLRYLGYDNLPASGAFTHPLLTKLPQGTAALSVTNYSTDVKKIMITVSWVETGVSKTHSVIFTTLIIANGL